MTTLRMPFERSLNEQGYVVVATLMIMLLLLVIGISSNTSTSLELQIANADRLRNEVFHAADGGINPAPRLITMARLEDPDLPDPALPDPLVPGTGITIHGNTGIFYDEVMGFLPENGRRAHNFSFSSGPDNAHDVKVGIDHQGARTLVGGSAEFASGADGIGTGATGGIEIRYGLTSEARVAAGGTSSRSRVMVLYRQVSGTAGGVQ